MKHWIPSTVISSPENIQAAEHLARFLEDSQLLLWLVPSTFVAMESKSTLAADDTIYHAVSATILESCCESSVTR